MIIKENTNLKIEEVKAKLKLTGDVYLYKEHFIESLESHKKLIPTSTAQTIEEAYQERVNWELEQEAKRKLIVESSKDKGTKDLEFEDEIEESEEESE